MKKPLTGLDIFGLGLMTFAFFLGAGNIIFPPLAGAQAGTELVPAMLGFLVTAVGLPLITLIAVAKAGGGISTMARYLPVKVATVLALAVYIIIGPSFATPRTGLVAYEIGVKPFIEHSAIALALFSVVFFSIVAWLAINPGKLLDYIGKFITPLLVMLLVALAIAVFVAPLDGLGVPTERYQDSAFINGFLEGYNTMDTFGALVFGMLIVNVLISKGVSEKAYIYKYLMIAGCIAAAGLAFVYVALFYLGATSQVVAQGATQGTDILAQYVFAMFGQTGLMALALVVMLACLTTAVGLVSALTTFLVQLQPHWNYTKLALINCAICALVTNVGLSQLISISIPVLFAVYPVAIALVALTFVSDKLANKKLSYQFVLAVALMFGVLDGLKVAGVDMQSFNYLPLFNNGMAWLLPTAGALLIAMFAFKKTTHVTAYSKG
ncbi:branched-chain amino acid transport system II carrier protein [Motilimonas eburnea]|uniref:branched-chain amino acid transport system II carrier protein n=1 Tax=Motilimonas eburnea TaxID=1737488 RepID=UPI001E3DAB26|nr:branched-chain amino acid transport system II carrier protein [Motilimonas eburnea]MCE2570896.1 branched-chain amino acid transport system II carrier protein [Motilimonas eburnea]